MKLPSGLLLLCFALTLLVRAEEAVPAKTEPAAVKRELVWPEIKDPQALIDFAKAEIAKLKASGNDFTEVDISRNLETAYLRPVMCYVTLDDLAIVIDTHPFTGQILLVSPTPNALIKPEKRWAKSEDTSIPEIKRVLARLESGYLPVQYSDMKLASIRWRKFQNIDKATNSWPKLLDMRFPNYPMDMLHNGISGLANIEFIVTQEGLVDALKVVATHEEFDVVVREIAKSWRFEPGIDLDKRLPANTKISLTVEFSLNDE